MSAAREQVGRLLALVPLIRRRGEMRVEEAAAALGVAPGQLVKDLRVLMYCGWPGWLPGDLIEVDLDALDGEGLVRITNADYLGAPLRLSAAEASAVVVALRVLRDAADPTTVEVVDRALAKLAAAAEDGDGADRVEVHVPADARALAGLRARLEGAVRDGRQVRLTYHVPSRDEDTERVVDPVAVVDAQGHTYLQGWCHLVDDRRLFRLDRVVAADVLDTPAVDHPDPAADDLSEGLFRLSEAATRATLRLSPRARWMVEYYPVEAVRELSDGGVEVDLAVADARWLRRLLLRLAPHATVLAPEELAADFTAHAGAALRLYR